MIGNSEDSSFEQVVMQKTQGKGVDVVLNSLPVNKLGASVNCLAQHGRFIQMKRSDLRNGNLNGNIKTKKFIIHMFLDENCRY